MIDETSATFYLAGPTAVGKSAIAVSLAERLGAEIVGCDAYQIYRGLPILTAQPEEPLSRRVPHHLVAEIPLTQTFDVASYLTLAHERIGQVHARGKPVLVVGGTGMYLRALTHGLAELPPGNPALREELEQMPAEERSAKLRHLDPAAFETVDLQNARRVIRALEVCILTGKPFSDHLTQWAPRPSDLKGAFLQRPREELNKRIDERVIQMFYQGVVCEVANAGEFGMTALKTLGLREIQQMISGEITQSQAIGMIQQATRQYAKRQMTWFRRETWLASINLSLTDLPETVADRLAEAFRSA